MFNLFNKADADDPTAIRNLRGILEKMDALKDADLDEPSEDISKESMDWYEKFAISSYEDITNTSQFNAKSKQQILLNSNKDYYSTKRRSGSLYTFQYEPESINLDYWDKFPLVLRMLDNSDSTESFLGMNLHYLAPKYRRLLMVSLISKLTGSVTDVDSRIIALGINKLMISSNRYGRVCIHRYKYDNIRGKALRIPPEHWLKIIYLPTYHFIGAKPAKIWQNSTNKIKRLRGET